MSERWRFSTSRSLSLLLAGLALVALSALPASRASAAPQTQAPDKALQHEVTVTVKLVQVYATGKGGKPVTDLTPEEFEIIDNGRSYPVTHFERHFPELEDASAVPTGVPRLNRKFFLVFDFAFMDANSILKAKNAALEFLKGPLRPTDEVGLVTYSITQGLVLHEYLTTDHQRVRKIVEGFGVSRYLGRAENLTQYIYSTEVAPPPGSKAAAEAPPVPDPENQFYQEQAQLQTGQLLDRAGRQTYVDQARHMIIALGHLARVLRSVPGFKNVVLFSGGIARRYLYGKKGGAVVGEWTTPEQLAAQLNAYDAAQADSGLRDDYAAMIKEFKASNCPVYSVDVSRLKREGDVLAQQAVSEAGLREFEGADSLRQFASGTGGRFFANTMQDERIAADIQTSTAAYYVLGYPVEETWDGKFHKVRVRVLRKGVDVETQGGYFSPKPFREYTSFERLLHIVDLALSEAPQFQVPFEIPVAALPLMVKGWPQVLVVGRASLAEQAEVLGKRTEVFLLVFNEPGDVTQISRLRPSLPEGEKGTVVPSFLLPLKPGSYRCAIVLRNMETGRGARGSASVNVAGQPAKALSLDPPLLLEPDTSSRDVASSAEAVPAALYSFDGEAFAPALGGIPAGREKLFAALRLSGAAAEARFGLAAALVDPQTGERRDVPLSIVKEGADRFARTWLVEVATGALPAGRKAVEFVVRDEGGGETLTTLVPVLVK